MAKKDDITTDPWVVKAMLDARDGSAMLAELDPELDWVDLRDLVGTKINIVDFEEGQPGLGDRKLRVRFIQEDNQPFRFSTEHNVIIKQLEMLEPYLPAWVTVIKVTSGAGRDYFMLD